MHDGGCAVASREGLNMGWGKKNARATSGEEIANILEASSVVRGDLRSDRGFRVDGKIEGSIESSAAIIIGETGKVTGDVRGVDVIVVGRVEGDIHASGHLDIRSTGRVIGDVSAASFRIETGGVFLGTSHMGQSAEEESEAAVPVGSLA
jgi:cytoskeletal protein CcmA (bactofilin family)